MSDPKSNSNRFRGHTAQSPLVTAMIRTAGSAVTRPEAVAPLLEALLLAYFCDDDDEVGNLKDRVSPYRARAFPKSLVTTSYL